MTSKTLAPSPAEIAARAEKFQNVLDELGLNGALLNRKEDVHYFSGYSGSDAVLLFAGKRRQLITDARYTEEAAKSVYNCEVVLWRKSFGWFAGTQCRKFKLRKIGYTPSALTVAFFNSLKDALDKSAAWQGIDAKIFELRAIKSRFEIQAMEAALACAEKAFAKAKKRWKAGMTEKEVKDDLEWEMRRFGASDAAFETIVAAGPNASLPHAHAGERLLKKGKMLLIDFGARVGYYNSDLTRTMWLEDIPRIWRKRYQAVLDSQLAAIDVIAAGVTGDVPDSAARAVLAKANMEEYFTHSLGHGVGLAVHEEPRLSRVYLKPLQPGQIVTVEPGVYFPGSGGIRIEDMAAVEKQGVRILSSLPKDPASAVL